jgi:hypothetical protein
MLPELLGTLAAKAEEIAAQTSRTSETVRQLLETMGRHSHGFEEPALIGAGVSGDRDARVLSRVRGR